jgi:hypothetical protein
VRFDRRHILSLHKSPFQREGSPYRSRTIRRLSSFFCYAFAASKPVNWTADLGCADFRRFFRSQCFANCFVAIGSHSESDARSAISTAAKYFGEFGAGFPRGTSSFAAINTATSCSCTPFALLWMNTKQQQLRKSLRCRD